MEPGLSLIAPQAVSTSFLKKFGREGREVVWRRLPFWQGERLEVRGQSSGFLGYIGRQSWASNPECGDSLSWGSPKTKQIYFMRGCERPVGAPRCDDLQGPLLLVRDRLPPIAVVSRAADA